MGQESSSHSAYLRSVEAEAFAQLRRARRAVEQEHGLTFRADDMHMRRPVIVGVDCDPQTADAQDRWHDTV